MLETCMFHQYTYTPGWVGSNTGSVLKLQLIIGNLSFIFATYDSWDLHILWLSMLNKNEDLTDSKPYFYLRLKYTEWNTL